MLCQEEGSRRKLECGAERDQGQSSMINWMWMPLRKRPPRKIGSHWLLRAHTVPFWTGTTPRDVAPIASATVRFLSSKRRDDSWRNIMGLPFTVSPEQALEKFQHWAIEEQGLGYLLSQQSIRIGAAYVPMWTFDLNIRFVRKDKASSQKYDWKPSMFRSAYGATSKVIHLPGLSAYAGYSYERSMIHPIHGESLVFLGKDLTPFARWMLRDMKVGDHILSVNPDSWNATRARARALVYEDLLKLAQVALTEEGGDASQVEVQMQVTESRRVYMPTFLIDYRILGALEYRAFVSGCDIGSTVSGVSHKLVDYTNEDIRNVSGGIFAGVLNAAQTFARVASTNRQVAGLAIVFLQFLANVLGRVLVRIPIVGVPLLGVMGFRKIIQPWLDSRWAKAEWDRQREHEALMDKEDLNTGSGSEFHDTSGRAEQFFRENRERILNSLGGTNENAHDQGDFGWYSEWERWAREQWERQQQQDSRGQQRQNYNRQQGSRKTKSKPNFQWDFDPSDPYAVLGVRRGATKSEVSAAFRKQMLLYHPDRLAPDATDAEKERATERSKLITEAYRRVKSNAV